jgi:hypothetical protein
LRSAKYEIDLTTTSVNDKSVLRDFSY